VIVALVDAGVPDEIAEMTGGVLSAVIVTVVDVAKLPDVSRATATMVLEPVDVAVLSQITE
jgi:hypothetical protein